MRSKRILTIALMAFGLIMTTALPALAKVPDWAIGTFTGRNPNGGGQIVLTINSNGNVTADFGGGNVIYGNLDNKTLRMGNDSSKISKINNGIRTTSKRFGRTETIDYRRSDGWGGGNGGGSGDNGWGWGNGSNPPSWAQGTFYGRNPQNGSPITMTVQSNGNVTIVMGGNTSYGTMTRSELRHGGYTARVSRIDNGIRTTSNGESIDYSRNYQGGGGGWEGGGGQMGQVPSWAIGTFRGTNPQNGTPITITIYSNGVVSINMNGYTNSATMYKDELNNNGNIARVTRIRNGIRTTSNGQSIDYYK